MSLRAFISLLVWEAYLQALDEGIISTVIGMRNFQSDAVSELED